MVKTYCRCPTSWQTALASCSAMRIERFWWQWDRGSGGGRRNETYDERTVELQVGDRLLLYSDGFEQAFPVVCGTADDLRKPTRCYREEFQELAALPSPQDMIERICRRLDVQSGSLHQIDDLTLLCLQAGPLVTNDALVYSGAAAAA